MEPSGVHILHIAANSDNEDVITLLASQWPAYVNAASDDGSTPLHVASTYGISIHHNANREHIS